MNQEQIDELENQPDEEHSMSDELSELLASNRALDIPISRWQLRSWKDEYLQLEASFLAQKALVRGIHNKAADTRLRLGDKLADIFTGHAKASTIEDVHNTATEVLEHDDKLRNVVNHMVRLVMTAYDEVHDAE